MGFFLDYLKSQVVADLHPQNHTLPLFGMDQRHHHYHQNQRKYRQGFEDLYFQCRYIRHLTTCSHQLDPSTLWTFVWHRYIFTAQLIFWLSSYSVLPFSCWLSSALTFWSWSRSCWNRRSFMQNQMHHGLNSMLQLAHPLLVGQEFGYFISFVL